METKGARTYIVEKGDNSADGVDNFFEITVDLEYTVGRHGAALAEDLEVGVGLLTELLDLESASSDDGAGMALMDKQPRFHLAGLRLQRPPQVSDDERAAPKQLISSQVERHRLPAPAVPGKHGAENNARRTTNGDGNERLGARPVDGTDRIN